MPGELIPITLFIMMGLVGVSYSPLGRAIGRMLSGGRDQELERELEGIRIELAELRAEFDERERSHAGQLEEIQSRLDFAERLLAQVRKERALPGQSVES